MPRGITNTDVDRRDLMKYLGAGGAAALAGCGGDGGGDSGDNGGQQTTTDPGGGGETTEPEQTGPVMGGRFTVGTRSEARSLNPLEVGDGATSDRVYKMMDGGLTIQFATKDSGTIGPLWFENWELNDSLDKVSIKLRENLDFGSYEGTDYGQITADTYLENITELFRGWYPYTYSYNFYAAGEPIRYEKTGKYSFTAELAEPQPFYLFQSGVKYSLVIPEQIISKYAANENAEGVRQDPAVNNAGFSGNLGPWSLQKWNRQSIIVYDRNEDWYLRDTDMDPWQQGEQDPDPDQDYSNAPYFDEHALQVFNSDNTQRQALRTGQIQTTGISVQRVDSFFNDDNITVETNPFISYSAYLGINQRANGWAGNRSQEVRWAFANLYNRNFIVDEILEGKGGAQGTLHPAWGPYYPSSDKLKSFEWTVERAKELLESGTSSDWGYDSQGTFRGPDGEQLELDLVYVAGTTDDLIGEYTKSRFADAGIQVNLETTGWAPLLINYFYTNNPAEGYESGEIGFGDDASQHPSVYNWGPWDKAVSSQSWDLMNTLGFSYGPYDPSGVISALYGERSAFNAYGFTSDEGYDYMAKADEIQSMTDRSEAAAGITEMLATLSQDQASVFDHNPYGYVGYWETVENYPTADEEEKVRESYWSDANYEQMYFSSGQSP